VEVSGSDLGGGRVTGGGFHSVRSYKGLKDPPSGLEDQGAGSGLWGTTGVDFTGEVPNSKRRE
jgi:hypothetical protein